MSSIPVERKKRGRPSTGAAPNIGIRLTPELIARIDASAAEHGESRSEAIRRLVGKALAS
jgi:metal-responsive CopG/Arc/MetJ family transcriptional regulator